MAEAEAEDECECGINKYGSSSSSSWWRVRVAGTRLVVGVVLLLVFAVYVWVEDVREGDGGGCGGVVGGRAAELVWLDESIAAALSSTVAINSEFIAGPRNARRAQQSGSQ